MSRAADEEPQDAFITASAVPAADAPLQQPQQQDEHMSPSQQPTDTAGTDKKKKRPKQYAQVQIPSHDQMMQEEFMNNCAVRTVLAGVMGSVLGLAFGVVMGSMDSGGAGLDANLAPAANAPKQTARQVLRQMVAGIRSRSWTYAKGFGAVGALYSGSECVVEKMRAQHDIWNSVYAGCFAGGTLAAGAGAKAACAGCVTFAAFSAMIDKVMER